MSRPTQDSSMAETQYHSPFPAGFSGRLKYADPKDLPSFPSSGLRKDGAAAGAAASLGWANQKSIDRWQPDKSQSASAAAVLAKDLKMAQHWEPNSSSAGAKAALLATASAKRRQTESAGSSPKHVGATFGNSAAAQATRMQRRASNPNPPQSSQATFGNSAASQAFIRSSTSVRRPAQTPVQPTQTTGRRRNTPGSLSAAKSVMTLRQRPRSQSTPLIEGTDPAESRAAANALKAATMAHGPASQPKPPTQKGGSVPWTAMPRNMYTSKPTIGPEAEEQKRADFIHASAVAMAKRMYSHQQNMVDRARDAQHGQVDASGEGTQAKPFVNLQEAAYKLAQERLAKLEEEHQRNRDYQEYYGGTPARRNTLQRRFTMKGKLRRRSSSDGDLDDRKQSEKIRQEMSIFSTNLSKVDEQKRAKDREAVLAAAQRNVRARLQGMDEKVFADTGKSPPPRKLSEWELKAHEAAQAMHQSRNEHRGQVNVGGGMFMKPEDVDAIAAKKVQPVLDEINEKAATERERQEMMRMEAEAIRKDQEKRKERDREIKEINKKLREQEKQEGKERKQHEKQEEKERKQHEKEEQKIKKDEERAAKAEEKRHAKEVKRQSKAASRGHDEGAAVGGGGGAGNHGDDTDSDENEPMTAVHPRPMVDTTEVTAAGHAADESSKSPKESGSPTHKMRSWLKSHFTRPRGKSSADATEEHRRGFIGGAALNRGLSGSSVSLDNRAASMREVAMAGTDQDEVVGAGAASGAIASGRVSRSVSLLSSDSEEMISGTQRGEMERSLTPPPKLKDPNKDKGGESPPRDSRFREMMD